MKFFGVNQLGVNKLGFNRMISSLSSITYGYTDTQIQAKITAGYIPIANAEDLHLVGITLTEGNERIFAAGTKWETDAITTTGRLGNYIQVCDIDLDHATLTALYPSWYNATTGWEPLCFESTFEGIYDGSDYEITNLYSRGTGIHRGLFYATTDAEVKNVRVLDVDIVNTYTAGYSYSGAIAGISTGSIFTNIGVTGSLNFQQGVIGGLVAYCNTPTASEFYRCYFNGSIISAGSSIGGIVGSTNPYQLKMSNCYAWGTVQGDSHVGGLIGHTSYLTVPYTLDLGILYSYAACIVTGNSDTGGAIGSQIYSLIYNVYYDSTISTQSDTDKGVGISSSDLKTSVSTALVNGTIVYCDWSNYIWDFGASNAYPILKRHPLERTAPQYMGAFKKYIHNPIVLGFTNEFYPVAVIYYDGYYYAIGKNEYGIELGMYRSANGKTNWVFQNNPVVAADIPWAIGQTEGNTFILKDGVFYIFYGLNIAEWHTAVGMSYCNTPNGTYTHYPTAIIESAGNDTLAQLGINFTGLSSPEIVRVGDTYYWFFYANKSDINEGGCFYLIMMTSPANDWLNITSKKVFFSTNDLDEIIPRDISVLQTPRIFYKGGYYYMILTAGNWQGTNKQRDLYVLRSKTIDGWSIENLQLTPILEADPVNWWDDLRVYCPDILRENDGHWLTPKIVDDNMRLYFSGHNIDTHINTGIMGLSFFPETDVLAAFWASLISIVVENAQPRNIVMTFSIANTDLVAADFLVHTAGTEKTISTLTRDETNKILTLELTTSLVYEEVVTVMLKDYYTSLITNNVVAPPPIIDSISVSAMTPTKIDILFDLDIDETSVPAITDFTLSTKTATGTIAISGKIVTITVTVAFAMGESCTITYIKPETGMIKSTDGGELDSFSATAIDNQVSAPALCADSNSVGWYVPSDANMVTAVAGVEQIYWDKRYGKEGELGALEESGTTVGGKVYKIIACTTNHFFVGNQVGDVFSATTEVEIQSINSVRKFTGNHLGTIGINYQPTNGIFNGISNGMKTGAFTWNQPEMIYMVVKQITWTYLDYIFDGLTQNSGALQQYMTTPKVIHYNNGTYPENATMPLNEWCIVRICFNGASSFGRINNLTPVTMTGTANMGGFTLGMSGGGGAYGNIAVKEIVNRKTADSTEDQTTIYNYLATKYGLPTI